MILKVIISIFLLFMASCVQPLSQGNGTGTDAGEAKIIGTAVLSDSLPGCDADVTLREQSYIPFSRQPQKQRTVKTDSHGSFEIVGISSGYYLVELWNKDSLCATKRFFVSNNGVIIDLGDIFLDTSVEFTGKVLREGLPVSGAQLLVMGLDKKVDLAPDGSFSLFLPKGEQLFRIAIDNISTDGEFLFSEDDRGDTLSINGTPSTSFESFDNLDGCNDLNGLLGGGWWFSYTDQAGGGNSRILPTEETGLIAAIDTTDEAYSGGSLHIIYRVDSLFSAPYALVGTNISYGIYDSSAGGKTWFDLRNMTAVTFMAKGSGTVYFQFTCKFDTLSDSYEFPFEVPFDPTSSWKKYTINSRDIPDMQISGASIVVPWSAGASSVRNITFLAKKSAEIWIDSIVIEGMNLKDFLK